MTPLECRFREQKRARMILKELIDSGHSITVLNKKGVVVRKSDNINELIKSMFVGDEDVLMAYKDDSARWTKKVCLTYGQSPKSRRAARRQ